MAAFLLTACSHEGQQAGESEFDFSGTCWTDGYNYYVGCVDTLALSDSLILFQGSNLHESGMGFALRIIAPETFIICTLPGKDKVDAGEIGDTVVLHQFDEEVMLICYRPDNSASDTLWLFDAGGNDPYEAYVEMLHQKYIDDLKGIYVNTQDGTRYQFTDSLYIVTSAKGTIDTLHYEIFYQPDMTSHMLKFSNGKQVWYEVYADGLDFYAANYKAAEKAYECGLLLFQTERL